MRSHPTGHTQSWTVKTVIFFIHLGMNIYGLAYICFYWQKKSIYLFSHWFKLSLQKEWFLYCNQLGILWHREFIPNTLRATLMGFLSGEYLFETLSNGYFSIVVVLKWVHNRERCLCKYPFFYLSLRVSHIFVGYNLM